MAKFCFKLISLLSNEKLQLICCYNPTAVLKCLLSIWGRKEIIVAVGSEKKADLGAGTELSLLLKTVLCTQFLFLNESPG